MTRTFFDFPRRFELSVGDCKKFSHTTQLRLLLRRRRLKSPMHDNYAVQMNETDCFLQLTQYINIYWAQEYFLVSWRYTRNIASSNSRCVYLYIEVSVWDFPVMSMTSPSRLIINNYWTRFSKISWFVGGEQINYLPKPKTEARHWQITIFCDNRVQ